MRLMKVVLALTALMLVVGCTATPTPANNGDVAPAVGGKLDGLHWVLVGMGDDTIPDVMQAWIEFAADGQVNGNGGCNGFFGNYEAKVDGTLSFGMIGMTEMWCEETGDLEVSFHEYLGSVTHYVAKDGELLMYDADDNVVLAFEAGEAATDSGNTDDGSLELGGELTDIRWLLTGMSDMELQFADVAIHITFGADNQANGNSGCNDFFGGYLFTPEGELSFGPLAMTRKMCADTDSFEQEFHTLIAEVTHYAVDGDKLNLLDVDGMAVLRFEMDPNTTVSHTPEPELGGKLDGYHWVLAALGGDDAEKVEAEAWIEFTADGQVNGNSACNTFFGSYEHDEAGTLSFGMFGMTSMMCADTDTLEIEIHQRLATVTSYISTRDELRMLDENGKVVLRFNMDPNTPVSDGYAMELGGDLTGHSWILAAMDDDAAEPLFPWVRIFIQFDESNNVTGNGGCNGYFGEYENDGEGNISFGPFGQTMMLCDDTGDMELAYHQRLGTVTAYSVSDDLLRLLDENGEVVLRYRADPVDASESFTRQMLDSGTYRNEYVDGGEVTLNKGVFRAPIMEGSASEVHVTLLNYAAFSDFEGDGLEDAAVIFVTNAGGTGSFYTLVVAKHRGDDIYGLEPVDLGDRIQVQDLRIEDGDIVIDMVRHGPDDPMCCPTEETTVTYRLQDGQLIEVADM